MFATLSAIIKELFDRLSDEEKRALSSAFWVLALFVLLGGTLWILIWILSVFYGHDDISLALSLFAALLAIMALTILSRRFDRRNKAVQNKVEKLLKKVEDHGEEHKSHLVLLENFLELMEEAKNSHMTVQEFLEEAKRLGLHKEQGPGD